MLITVSPGQSIATTITLPKPATAQVRWAIRDHNGALVLRGTQSPNGPIVQINGVLPSNVVVPLDGSKYSLTATDGAVIASEYFSVVSVDGGPLSDHALEIVYLVGSKFKATLITDRIHEKVEFKLMHINGTTLVNTVQITDEPQVYGNGYIYKYESAAAIDMVTNQTYGTGLALWTKTDNDISNDEMHPFYTITPRVTDFMNGIKKIVDKSRMGDSNKYLEYTTSDFIHATLRGADYVAQSEPLMTPFALDTIPTPLRDFVIKAGAIDILRAQHQAEGMSAFDFQGLGVQLTTDRTQYLDSLISALTSDLEKLPMIKKGWLSAGQITDTNGLPRKRAIGALGVSVGAFTNQPMVPGPIILGGAGMYSFQRYGVWR